VTAPRELRIATGTVREPPSEPYPRLLATRHWPRDAPRGAVDQWERDLGPSEELQAAYDRGEVDSHEFERRYSEEMRGRTSLLAWAARMALGTGVALLCDVHDGERCHLDVLVDLVREHAERAG
jgi:uncharacterized protein YeaO (DUF488 family)